MNYTQVDKNEVGLALFREDAVRAGRDAFAAKCEIERIESLAELAKTKEEKDSIQEALDKAKEHCAKVEKRAARKKRLAEGVTEVDIAKANKEFVEMWLKQIETEHVQHTARIISIEEDIEEDDDLTDEEVTQLQQASENLADAMKVLESAWEIAKKHLEELDKLVEEEPEVQGHSHPH